MFTHDETVILKTLTPNGQFCDDIAEELGWTVSRVLGTCTLLELKGVVRQLSGKRFASVCNSYEDLTDRIKDAYNFKCTKCGQLMIPEFIRDLPDDTGKLYIDTPFRCPECLHVDTYYV